MKNSKRILSIIFSLLLMLSVLSGCELQSDDDKAIMDAVEKLQKSINEEDLDAFIECLHPDTIEPILSALDSAETLGYSKEETSADIFGRFSSDPSSVELEVGSITYNDSKTEASADVTLTASDTKSVTSKIDFIKSEEEWYIDGENMI